MATRSEAQRLWRLFAFLLVLLSQAVSAGVNVTVTVPPCSHGRRDLGLCCCPRGPLLAEYRTGAGCNHVLMHVSVPLEGAALPPPCPESAEELERPFCALSPSASRQLSHNRRATPLKGQAFAVREESCRTRWLLGRRFGELHPLPAVTRHLHSRFLLCSSAKINSEGSALPGIT